MDSCKINFYLYLFFYFVYNLQGILYPTGSLLSQTSVLILILQGIFAFQYTLRMRRTPSFINLWSAFFIITAIVFVVSDKVVYGTIYEAIGEVSTLSQFKGILVFLLAIYVSYIYARKCEYNEKLIRNIVIALALLSFMRYVLNYQLMQAELSVEGFTNNAGYNLVSSLALLPFVLRRRKILAIGIFILFAFLIMIASKRGAIVCMFVLFLFSLYYYSRQYHFSIKKYLVLSLFVVGFGVMIYSNYLSNEYLQNRMERMEERGIGSRSVAYRVLWEHWVYDKNVLTKILGNGTAQSIAVWGNYAHNDWLEILIDYGLLGVIMYLLLFIFAWKYFYFSQLGFWERWCAYLCLIVWFLKSVFSMGFTNLDNVLIIFYLGLCIGLNENKGYVAGVKPSPEE